MAKKWSAAWPLTDQFILGAASHFLSLVSCANVCCTRTILQNTCMVWNATLWLWNGTLEACDQKGPCPSVSTPKIFNKVGGTNYTLVNPWNDYALSGLAGCTCSHFKLAVSSAMLPWCREGRKAGNTGAKILVQSVRRRCQKRQEICKCGATRYIFFAKPN